jgi:hypothetical protein
MKPHLAQAHDPYWYEEVHLFDGTFRYYHNKPQRVWAKFHLLEERYFDVNHEIVPIKTLKGTRTYVHVQPYINEPVLTLTIAVKPKTYTDLGETVGTVKSSDVTGVKDAEIGTGQAWYYHKDEMLVLWECYLNRFFRDTPLLEDSNMQKLWNRFEQWLLTRFPKSTTIVTPFRDPLYADSEYQRFLRLLGYKPIAQAAYGKSRG